MNIVELNSSGYLNHETAIGITQKVIAEGVTAGLTEPQIKALQISINQFPESTCISCSRKRVIKAGDEPDFCYMCKEEISFM
ncbi:hypothetical protein [Fibrella forsythiae]|uniref:Uncharacterized protein n=1 Tax=Fibrella forsythiae TaxID=2817061 RepID=A0ABS3JHI6_9BACT|nr:hypothetical protein [Fibrella forsythiae]MBO0949458.1 hypothetical protein [Fibrella forsythiae]